MMLRHLGWNEAADRIISAMQKTNEQKVDTYDFARLMANARLVKTWEFADALIKNMDDIG